MADQCLDVPDEMAAGPPAEHCAVYARGSLQVGSEPLDLRGCRDGVVQQECGPGTHEHDEGVQEEPVRVLLEFPQWSLAVILHGIQTLNTDKNRHLSDDFGGPVDISVLEVR